MLYTCILFLLLLLLILIAKDVVNYTQFTAYFYYIY